VIGDRSEVHSFQSHELTTDFTYVRFHHGTRGACGNYSESELEEWARRFEDGARHVAIWAYFNNELWGRSHGWCAYVMPVRRERACTVRVVGQRGT
jgi:uncharacterized protein YecE (DUF72 family)